ncbi:MAG: IMP cyclohydrolase, partial [Aristaeellaceae bacterium]
DENSVLRYFYDYCQPKAGEGHFIHTYKCDGNPIPSFEGEPEKVTLKGDIEQLALDTWMNLNEDNKVSLYVSFISLKDGSADTIIINKHDQEED